MNALFFVANTGLIFSTCLLLFKFDAPGVVDFDNMLPWLDGHHHILISELKRAWALADFQFHFNPMSGLSDFFIPINVFGKVSYWISLLTTDMALHPIVGSAVHATEAATGTYLLARSLFTLPPVLAAASSWCVLILLYPLLGAPQLWAIFSISSAFGSYILVQGAFVYFICKIGRHGTVSDLICAGILSLLSLYVPLTYPLGTILLIPVVLLVIASFFKDPTFDVLAKQFSSLFFVLLVLAATGVFSYLMILGLYNAYNFFGNDFTVSYPGYSFISIGFRYEIDGPISVILVLSAVVSLLFLIIWSKKQVRGVYIVVFITVFLVFAVGVSLNLLKVGGVGPPLIYFEILLWPVYVIVSIKACSEILRSLMASRTFGWTGTRVPQLHKPSVIGCISVSSLLVTAGLLWIAEIPARLPLSNPSPVVEHLSRKLALRPGSVFAGSVANFVGVKRDKPTTWIDQHHADAVIVRAQGTDLRISGLWEAGIPTLIQYSQSMTPQYFKVLSSVLAEEMDHQTRNVVVLTKIVPKLLKLFGVRFVITDRKVYEELGSPILSHSIGNRDAAGVQKEAYLYRLSDTNVGNYSPTEVVYANGVEQSISALAALDDPRRQVVSTSPLPEGLSAAQSATLRFDKGSIRVTAVSSGVSLLVLPIQFTHCLTAKEGEGRNDYRLVRANVMQLGVIFERKLDVSLKNGFGIGNDDCRWQDYRDWVALSSGDDDIGGTRKMTE